MLLIFGILLILACVILGFFVLVQNPKGGGLSGSFGGFGNQVIGVRQTTDVLEKGTWIMATIIAVLCLTSSFFIGKTTVAQQQQKAIMEQNAGKVMTAPAAPAPNVTVPTVTPGAPAPAAQGAAPAASQPAPAPAPAQQTPAPAPSNGGTHRR
jgi:preprotein translocase subunit SecG